MDDGFWGRHLELLWLCALAAWLALTAFGRIVPLMNAPEAVRIERYFSRGVDFALADGNAKQAGVQPMPDGLAIYLQLHHSRDQAAPQQANICSP
ncbi:MAG: hypothetical protein JWN94_1558 [Betaproteobacteria bacterium]|nr:hypothetical protein [Betaproteobacteria bacterium]